MIPLVALSIFHPVVSRRKKNSSPTRPHSVIEAERPTQLSASAEISQASDPVLVCVEKVEGAERSTVSE